MTDLREAAAAAGLLDDVIRSDWKVEMMEDMLYRVSLWISYMPYHRRYEPYQLRQQIIEYYSNRLSEGGCTENIIQGIADLIVSRLRKTRDHDEQSGETTATMNF